jgi:hypothetical protein
MVVLAFVRDIPAAGFLQLKGGVVLDWASQPAFAIPPAVSSSLLMARSCMQVSHLHACYGCLTLSALAVQGANHLLLRVTRQITHCPS